MAPAIEPHRKLGPRRFWNPFEQICEGFGCGPGEASDEIERHRAIAREVLSADRAGLMHG